MAAERARAAPFHIVKHVPAPLPLTLQAGAVLRPWGCPGLQRQRIGGVPDIAHRRHGRQLCDAPGGARAGVCGGAAAERRGAVRFARTRPPRDLHTSPACSRHTNSGIFLSEGSSLASLLLPVVVTPRRMLIMEQRDVLLHAPAWTRQQG